MSGAHRICPPLHFLYWERGCRAGACIHSRGTRSRPSLRPKILLRANVTEGCGGGKPNHWRESKSCRRSSASGGAREETGSAPRNPRGPESAGLRKPRGRQGRKGEPRRTSEGTGSPKAATRKAPGLGKKRGGGAGQASKADWGAGRGKRKCLAPQEPTALEPPAREAAGEFAGQRAAKSLRGGLESQEGRRGAPCKMRRKWDASGQGAAGNSLQLRQAQQPR